ncbi:MAG: phage major capsid protein [Dehalococcoidia bacterium]|jgi:HK97 family phage major capsid protein
MKGRYAEEIHALQTKANAKLAEGDFDNAELILKEAEDLKAKSVREADLLKRAQGLGNAVEMEHPQQPAPEVKTRFDDMDDWMESVAKWYSKGHVDPRLKLWSELGDNSLPIINEQKQMVENVGASGGFLVPVEQYNGIMAIAAEKSIVRQRANIIRMARRQMDFTVLDQTGTAAGVGHWFGGMLFYWADEAAEKTITTASWRQMSLVAKKLIGYTRASDELVADASISLNDFLSGPFGFAGGVAWMEDYAFLNGTGVGQPLGVINAGATISVARQVQQSVTYEDLTQMQENHMGEDSAVWVASISLKHVLMNMTYPTGNPALVWQPSAREGMPGTLFGRPIYWTEKVPSRGNAGDIGLYDFSQYLLGDRQATTITTSGDEFFRYDQTSWRVVHRIDGRPWLNAPLTLQDGTSTVSPFVILGAKST